ncbi:MAG: pknD 8 [Verrucomicrobiales bacterium]|nr:pknD 8 [Verrucomicrobiales bacterium]
MNRVSFALVVLACSIAVSSLAQTADTKNFIYNEDVISTSQLTGNNGQTVGLTFIISSLPAHATLLTNTPYDTLTSGLLKYQPFTTTNWYGTDSFQFRVASGGVTSAVATVSITVSNINDAPLAHNQSVRTQTNQSVAITLTGDDDGDWPYNATATNQNYHYSPYQSLPTNAVFTILTQPASGTLTGTAPNVVYQPNTNFGGNDQFTFKVNDGTIDSGSGTVRVWVASFAIPEGGTTNLHTNVPFASSIIRPGFTNQCLTTNGTPYVITASGRTDDGAQQKTPSGDRFSRPLLFNWYGTNYTNFYVNNNGLISFATSNNIAPTTIQLFPQAKGPQLAGFWTDVDTLNTNRGGVINWNASASFVKGRQAVGLTWNDVGRFSSNATNLNRFQMVLIDRSDIHLGCFEVEYNYEYLEWLTGAYATNAYPMVGYDAGNGVNFENFPGSGTTNIIKNLTNSLGRISYLITTSPPPSFSFPIFSGINGVTNVVFNVLAKPSPVGFPTRVELQYGLTTNYTSTVYSAYTTNTNGVKINMAVEPGTAYQCRFVVTNDVGATSTSNFTFTSYGLPTATYLSGYPYPAALIGTGGYYAWVAFQWGTTTNYGNTTFGEYVADGGTTSAFVITSPGTYQFRAILTNDQASVYGTNGTFTIPYNVNLSGLQVNALTFNEGVFNGSGNTTNYTLTIPSSVGDATVFATPLDATTNVYLTYQLNGGSYTTNKGPFALALGTSTINVRVNAANDSTNKTYRITVTRIASNDAKLGSLAVTSGTVSPPFNSLTNIYSASVAYDVTNVLVTATAAYSNASVRINGGSYAVATNTASVSLAFGNNSIPILDQAENGVTTTSYTLNVARSFNTNGVLSSLTLSDGTLSPSFSPSNTAYTVTVNAGVSNMTVNAATTNAYAQIQINGNSYQDLTNSRTLPLNFGNTIITTLVQSQSGTVKVYTVTVTRLTHTPQTLTMLPTAIGFTNATLNASIIPAFLDTSYFFGYGTNASLGSVTSTNTVPADNNPTNVSILLTGLQPGRSYQYRVNVFNGSATNSGTNVTFTTLAAPSITTHPLSQSIKQGSNVTFTVVAAGGNPLSYQWLFNGTNISGAEAQLTNYTRANLQFPDAGSYSVIISNAAGSFTSSNALLTIIPAVVHLDALTVLSNRQLRLQMSGDSGTYWVDQTSDLTNWFPLINVTNTNGIFEITDPETNISLRFYRTRTP